MVRRERLLFINASRDIMVRGSERAMAKPAENLSHRMASGGAEAPVARALVWRRVLIWSSVLTMLAVALLFLKAV